ncbi:beta-1,3-glucanosyltransferase [Metarhizium guizhouense ARSEF 977]|uniref:1,3-beta-glucanosyltransferase n=1 Tax=Metarhizium guizhouense (strain ARSEF 977) TaxID=1276136 RepID=A0A0B4GKY7_METGA|nr:beta-1,3-glucanosyltransferase [Metarhizium guizhouense ARSEF 977]
MIPSSLSLSLLALAGGALGADLPSIQMKGSKFFFPNGTQFFFKGVAYQQQTGAAGSTPTNSSFIDPLADTKRCQADVPNLVALKTNVIRVYAIDPTKDHSTCMKLLNDNGIYVVADLGEPSLSINRDNPAWDTALFTRYQQVVDEMAKYSNTIGFFAGNEVSNANNNTGASAYVKAAARDTKAYIKSKKYRWMGVGYAANDDKPIRDQIASYFNCGPLEDSIDFFGYNIYSWCGSSNFEASGYNRLIEFFKDYSVPMFFAEYGCNLPNGGDGRTYDETTALYLKNMTDAVSGGIVYEYFQETNDYGLVEVSSDGSVSKRKDFAALQSKISAVDPKGVTMDSYNPTAKVMDCPAVNSSWQASATLPPTPNDSACDCMFKAASCVPANSLKADDFGDIFGYICGSDRSLCAGIDGNFTTGKYGTYSMCSSKQKLAFVLDAYYKKNKNAASSCDFKGQATTQSASGSQSNCAKLAPSNGGNSTSSGGNGSDSFAVKGAPLTRVGNSAVGLYLAAALFVVGMVAW